jgi:hypothetical protein
MNPCPVTPAARPIDRYREGLQLVGDAVAKVQVVGCQADHQAPVAGVHSREQMGDKSTGLDGGPGTPTRCHAPCNRLWMRSDSNASGATRRIARQVSADEHPGLSCKFVTATFRRQAISPCERADGVLTLNVGHISLLASCLQLACPFWALTARGTPTILISEQLIYE